MSMWQRIKKLIGIDKPLWNWYGELEDDVID